MVDWQKFDITSEMVILAILAIAVLMHDKDIANVAVGGLIGFLTKKAQG